MTPTTNRSKFDGKIKVSMELLQRDRNPILSCKDPEA